MQSNSVIIIFKHYTKKIQKKSEDLFESLSICINILENPGYEKYVVNYIVSISMYGHDSTNFVDHNHKRYRMFPQGVLLFLFL